MIGGVVVTTTTTKLEMLEKLGCRSSETGLKRVFGKWNNGTKKDVSQPEQLATLHSLDEPDRFCIGAIPLELT